MLHSTNKKIGKNSGRPIFFLENEHRRQAQEPR
jgi:hypothetical protein